MGLKADTQPCIFLMLFLTLFYLFARPTGQTIAYCKKKSSFSQRSENMEWKATTSFILTMRIELNM